MQKTILFLDLNNLAIRTLLNDGAGILKEPNPSYDKHKHDFLNSIFSNIKKFCPDEVICAVDDRMNWRKKVFPDYKAHRKEKRDKDIFPWPVYFEYISNFINEVKILFPFKFIQVPYTEADDIIAVLCMHLTESDNVIVTTDSDYIQLLKLKNVRLWDPLKKKQVLDEDPAKTLHIKIICGDKTDEIPNIKERVGEKTAIKLIDSGELETLLKDETIKKNYERNKFLIDWNFIPPSIKKEILKRYDEYQLVSIFDTMKVMSFFVKHRLRQHTQNLSSIKVTMRTLIPNNDSIKSFF